MCKRGGGGGDVDHSARKFLGMPQLSGGRRTKRENRKIYENGKNNNNTNRLTTPQKARKVFEEKADDFPVVAPTRLHLFARILYSSLDLTRLWRQVARRYRHILPRDKGERHHSEGEKKIQRSISLSLCGNLFLFFSRCGRRHFRRGNKCGTGGGVSWNAAFSEENKEKEVRNVIRSRRLFRRKSGDEKGRIVDRVFRRSFDI